MKNLLTSLAITIVLVSCGQKKTEVPAFTTIDFSINAVQAINLSDFCSSVDYITLETRPDCIIKTVRKIKFFGDSIFILNELGWNMSEILVFDRTGSFLTKFGKIGSGPEEIDNPRDIIKFGDSYLIWDREKVAEFDKTGKFKKKMFDAFVHGSEFFTNSKNIYLYHGTEFPGILTKYDLNGTLTDTLKPTDPKHQNTSFEGENVVLAGNEFHLFAPAFDTVWTLNNNMIIPKYYLDFKDETTLEEFFKNVTTTDPMQRLSALNSTPTSNVLTFLENENYLFLKYKKTKSSSYKIINKKTNQKLDFTSCINNIDNGIFGNPIAITREEIVIPLESIKILKHFKKNTSLAKPKFKELCESIKEDSNPVIMLCKLDLLTTPRPFSGKQ
jgi:hypothetical protein